MSNPADTTGDIPDVVARSGAAHASASQAMAVSSTAPADTSIPRPRSDSVIARVRGAADPSRVARSAVALGAASCA